MQPYNSIIVSVVVVILMTVLMGAAQRGKPTVLPGTEFLLFRHHFLFRAFAFFAAFVIPLGITALIILFPPHAQSDFLPILFLYALFGALGAPLFLESFRFALVLGPEGLDCRSPWRGQQFIRWDEVEDLSYSPAMGWFIIRSVDGRKFRVSALVSGLGTFLEMCEQRLPVEKMKKAQAGYAILGRPFPEQKREV